MPHQTRVLAVCTTLNSYPDASNQVTISPIFNMSTGSITLYTHLDGGQASRQIELTEHDTVHTLF
jgi:hypothetical protein